MQAAVLGQPISHSLSPVLHNAAYTALGLTDWSYDAIECDADGLAALLADKDPRQWAGFSCTMPLKRAVLELADEADRLAIVVGAANTLLPRGGGWRAAMTDVTGIVAALGEVDACFYDVTILGAGGSAQAALAAVAASGASTCSALVRDLARADQLQATAARLGVGLEVSVLEVGASAFNADLVISTLPTQAADPYAERKWRSDQVVLDVVYDQWPTVFAAAAQQRGAKVVSGASMLLYQAAAQVRLMTGRPAPIEAMRAALRDAAPGCGV